MAELNCPEKLRAFVASNLEPVEPERFSFKEGVSNLAPAAVNLALALGLFGLRADHDQLGFWMVWGGSALLLTFSCLLFSACVFAYRPASRVNWQVTLCLLLSGTASFAALHGLSGFLSPDPAEAFSISAMVLCLVARLTSGGAILFLASRVMWRGLALQPAWPGALAGLSAALSVEAAWRLQCEHSAFAHVMSGHFLPAGILAVAGVFWATRVSRKSAAERRRIAHSLT